MIIGEKDVFAIEFHQVSDGYQGFGNICYWVKGEPYGNLEEYNTLGLLSSGLESERLPQFINLDTELSLQAYDEEDIEEIAEQLSANVSSPGQSTYRYTYYTIVIEASEAFDGYEVYLLRDSKRNTWVIARDRICSRCSCVAIREEWVWETLRQLSEIIRNALL